MPDAFDNARTYHLQSPDPPFRCAAQLLEKLGAELASEEAMKDDLCNELNVLVQVGHAEMCTNMFAQPAAA